MQRAKTQPRPELTFIKKNMNNQSLEPEEKKKKRSQTNLREDEVLPAIVAEVVSTVEGVGLGNGDLVTEGSETLDLLGSVDNTWG